eukprot:702620-Pyramimonas_sp.AAC.1
MANMISYISSSGVFTRVMFGVLIRLDSANTRLAPPHQQSAQQMLWTAIHASLRSPARMVDGSCGHNEGLASTWFLDA